MVAPAQLASPARESHIAALIACGIAVTLVTMRLFEAPYNPATYIRLCVSLAAIGCVVLARQRSVVQRAVIFVALDGLGGVIAFAFVDVPFVIGHQEQIGHLALALARVLNAH